MSSSRRARSMARNHRRLHGPTKLNLVALMDIFTILVLFLIVNNGDVEVLQSDEKVALPESVSEQRPGANIVIKITEAEILLADQSVLTVEEALAAPEGALSELVKALDSLPLAEANVEEDESSEGRPITIMGHKDTPYALLTRVMATCAETDYRDVSLAVNSVPGEEVPTQESTLAMAGTEAARDL